MTTTELHTNSPIQVAKEARTALRKAFPSTKFSLTGTRGTGYGFLHLSWTDGPTRHDVEQITNEFDARLGIDRCILINRSYSAEAIALANEKAADRGEWQHAEDEYFYSRRILEELTF